MNIGIDIDDTLTNYHRERLSTIKKFIKTNNLDVQIVDSNASNTLKICNWNTDQCHMWWDTIGNNLLKICKAQKYCKQTIDYLKSQGHNIILITARNDEWHGDAKQITENWLKNNGIVYDKILFDCATKTQPMLDENIDIMIDDSYKVCLEAVELNKTPILFSGPQNKTFSHEKVLRVKTWKQIYRYFKG